MLRGGSGVRIGGIATIWLASAGIAAAAPAPQLLPTPRAMTVAQGGFAVANEMRVIAERDDPGARKAARRLIELMRSQKIALIPADGGRTGSGPAVRFRRVPGMAPEAYRLTTGGSGATISATGDAGLFYGAVTLWQLATQGDGRHRVAAVTIDDAPRFAWRGLMLDSARHFQSPAFIRRLIDWMAANKLNRLHWHLVDDQGWRLEIKGYPRLTTVSAWRRPATAPGAPQLPVTGGFYTQAEVRRLVAYAAERGITTVPEIEMPGHALSAIRAYPALGMGVPIPPGTESDWGVFPWLYNTDERTFTFLEAVLAQVMDLFPSPWIHVGGDEAVKDQWRASPAIQAKIRALGLKDEDALQGWFVARIGKYLASKGRRLIGWDEILDGGVPANATVMSWRGIDGAATAVQTGHDAILSPAPTLYVNNRQGTGPQEPPGRGDLITLSDVLAFAPMPAGLTPEQRAHIVGLQANLWTEHTRTEARAAWMMFPRASAVAETGWAAERPRDVGTFMRAVMPQLDRMRPMGLVAADSAHAVQGTLDIGDGGISVTLGNQAGVPMHYSLNAGTPTIKSPQYLGPLSLPAGTRLRAMAFLGARALPGGYDRVASLAAARTHTSRELTPCSKAVLLDLEDDYPATGPRAHFLLDIFNPCWQWPAAPMAGARRIAVTVGQVPFNFQVGRDREKIRFRPPASPDGEVEIRAGGCEGRRITVLPLAPAARFAGVTRLVADLPALADRSDLCITYTARGPDPLWAIDTVELLTK